MKLSAVLIVKNESRNLRDCLRSLSFADEIVVVDSGSDDGTPEIAREFTDKVFTRAFDDFGSQKNYAVGRASGEWVLSVDADERVTEELGREISAAVASGRPEEAYRIPRHTFFLGRRLRFSGTQNDRPVRLFRRGGGAFDQPIHEFFAARGRVGALTRPLLHYTTETVEREKAKIEFYTSLEAPFLASRGVRVGRLGGFLRACAVFLRHYVVQLGFLDGREGFLFAYFSYAYARRKYAKLRELRRMRALEPRIEKAFDDFASKLPDRIDRADSRLRALLDACGPAAGKDVLEVGCGKGRFAEVFVEAGARVTGIDPSEELLKHARRLRGTFVQASATALPFADASFDVVYAVEVIEHLPFLERSIAEMARVLRKGGTLVLLDRNKYSLSQKRFLVPNALIKRWHEMRNHWIYPDDFPFRERRFSKGQVLRLLSAQGLAADARFVQTDGEKTCTWHVLFDRIPALRIFILWRGRK